MENFIKALEILIKYGNVHYPFNCSHDLLFIDVDPKKVSDDDILKLGEFYIYPNDDNEGFESTFYGSC